MKQQPLYFLVYDVNLEHGATNYSNNTAPISGVTLDLVPDAAWFNATGGIVRMVNVVREGLLATNQAEKWGLGRWPSSTVGNSPFDNRVQRFEVAVELVNADGKTIGSERVTMESGYNVEWRGDYNNRSIRLLYPRLEGVRSLGFSRVNAYDITDRLTVRIAGIDGVAAETAAKAKGVNILTEAEYARLPDVAAGLDSRSIVHLPDFEIDASGTVTGYKGSGGKAVIPANFLGTPVTAIGKKGSFGPIGKNLTSVVIPNSVISIGDWAFSDNRLTSVVIPNSVTSIGSDAFANNQLTSVVIGNSVTRIDKWAFRDNQLTSVVIPNSVTSIGGAAFRGNQLTSVVIPNSVISIDSEAFYGNPLISVVIGNNVDIAAGAFSTRKVELTTLKGEGISYFENTYRRNKKKAGTYTRPDTRYTYWKWKP
jgi:hypothetical protein